MIALALLLAAETELHAPAYLLFLARHQRADGSWGERPTTCACPPAPADLPAKLGLEPGAGDVELTALALLTFLGAGYSHFSKDRFEGLCFGDVIRRGLDWLVLRQDAEGWFDFFDAAANAIAAFCLHEAYLNTGAWREPALRGLMGVERFRPGGARASTWKAHALWAGKRWTEAAADREGPLPIAVRALHRPKADPSEVGRLAARGPDSMDLETRLFTATVLVRHPKSDAWRRWGPALRDALVASLSPERTRCERSSWAGLTWRGRLRATALNGSALQVYYRYACAFGRPT